MFRCLRFCKRGKYTFLWLKAVEHYTSWVYEKGKVGVLQSLLWKIKWTPKYWYVLKLYWLVFSFYRISIPVHLSISFPCISCRWSSRLSDTRQGSKLLWWAASCWWTSCLDCGWSSVWQQRSQDRWRSESHWSLT